MNLTNAFDLTCQRYLALMAIAAVAILAGFSMISSNGLTGGRIVSQIENDLGVSPATPGDHGAIYLFRFVSVRDADKTPAAHFIDMMEVTPHLLAGRFAAKDRDVLYIGKADTSQSTKLVQIVSQLLFPLVTLEGVINLPN
ncbi:hypothetical protein [Erythrobacter sanguineus]|uniref:Uncharacterized protein n=2 Tax=Erythrobacter sanguineus TaxID=198312 RepID=A0A1M7T2D2_9SPHN|nr:hypothetical protein [Erythrobacter sanguineus]SHN64915.1 hypothetical protein SAMN02745193_02801 [Erythrobacter sanguineus]